jgi:MFS family permease
MQEMALDGACRAGRKQGMHEPIQRPAALRIPPLIKRNTALFALSQSFTGAGTPLAFGLGPLMVVALTGSASLSGLSVCLFGLSRFFVSYPVGRITDTYGRKPGIFLGLTLALVGAVIVSLAMNGRSFPLLVVGMLVFGMGVQASQQMRVAATDMFPPTMRARALGYVALGSLAGLVVTPLVVSISESVAHTTGRDPLALPWLVVPLLIVGGMVVVSFVRPDPKWIGQNLAQYYPGYAAPAPTAQDAAAFSAMALIRSPPLRLAIASNCAAQGNMSIVMVLTSLVLSHHGHSLGAIAFSQMFHSAGMFAFTIPLGRLADRFGRERVMYPGVATALLGAGLVTFTSAYVTITLGTFLVGVGWAAANVAATAFIADHYDTAHRGRAIGVNDSFAGGMTIATAVVTGPLVQWAGLPAAGATAVAVALIPLVMLAIERTAGRLLPAPGA